MIKINVRAFMLIVMAALTGVTVAAVIAAIAWLAFDLVRQVNSPIIIFVAMTAARGAFSAGMISGLITEMKPAAKIITDIMEEADRAYADFKKIYG